jgi:ribonuclease BN (tRNA processing enzyme)
MFFPRSSRNKWRFSLDVRELELQHETNLLGHSVTTAEVLHYSGAPSTAVRVSDGQRTFAYSGDTQWTDSLIPIADDADLFIVECYAYSGDPPGHLTWSILRPRLKELRAKRVMLTHMNPTMLERLDEARAAGVLIAEDGAILEF